MASQLSAKIAILSTAPPANMFNRVNKPPPPELNAAWNCAMSIPGTGMKCAYSVDDQNE